MASTIRHRLLGRLLRAHLAAYQRLHLPAPRAGVGVAGQLRLDHPDRAREAPQGERWLAHVARSSFKMQVCLRPYKMPHRLLWIR